ncbi:AsmA-like C-terminal region-containing protein [Tenacibaculum bernardetii]|uniref:AsmA-like C-terminal region-containing protein n=1 Tax=Tenacibaculum bernardetii TaxID=3021375 RepID=UPI0023AF8F28|nr:AsmA-like C-terminal region-containing protein [Tenacibaculum bernardetii]
MTVKKTIKRISIIFIILFSILMLVIGIGVNFIFTPTKVTPQIIELLNENVNGKIACEEIEPVFFSTFPYFSINMRNGSIRSNKIILEKNIHLNKNDTLVKFEHCQITFNLMRLLTKKGIDIKKISFKKPEIYAFVDGKGKANWNILKESKETVPKDSTTTDVSKYLKTFNIDKLQIEKANLHYEDSLTQALVTVSDFNLDLSIRKNKEGLVFGVDANGKKISFIKDDKLFLSRLNLNIKTQLNYVKNTNKIHVNESLLNANGIEFIAGGDLKIDRVNKKIDTDLQLELNVPSLKTIIALVPKSVLQNKSDLITYGAVVLNANVKGAYGKDIFPDIYTSLKINNGAFKFRKFPGEIDVFKTSANAFINFNTPSKSYVNIKDLQIKGTGIDLNVNGEIKNLINNPAIDIKVKSKVDFNILKETFPINKDIEASGIANINLSTTFTKNAIINQDYKSINAFGTLELNEVLIDHKTADFVFKSQKTNIVFGKNNNAKQESNLTGDIAFKDLIFKYKKKHSIKLEALNLGLDTQEISPKNKVLNANISLKNLDYAFGDSIKGIIKKSKAKISFKSTKYKKRPLTISNFTIDSAAIWGYKRFIGIKQGKYQLTFENDENKKWQPKGAVEFDALYVYTPKFPLLLHMKHSKVSIKNDELQLNNAKFIFGKSDATLTGSFSNFIASIQNKKKIKAVLNFEADFIDTNEIMNLLNNIDLSKASADNLPKKDTVSTAKKVAFVVPKNIDFKFNTNIKKVKWGENNFTDIYGLMTVKEGEINLHDLKLTTLQSQLQTSIAYKAETIKEAKIEFDFNLYNVQMHNLVKIVPTLDSLFPMSKSFEGKVDFRMKGKANLNNNMEVVIPSVKSIAALKAKNLIVFDGPTFRDLAKTLMFKNKQTTPVSSLQVEMQVENSKLKIYPAEIIIDRYRLAVGGTQNLDMTYNYHVSILKSPVPFKAGVDISGNFDDYNIDITRAKYKYYFTEKERLIRKADTTIVNKKLEIKKELGF